MSKFKDQIIAYLKEIDLQGSKVLSIGGGQEPDSRYFKSFEYDEYQILDADENFKPDLVYNLNDPIIDNDGNVLLDYSFGENYDVILALNIWEYIWNPVIAHDNLSFFLKAGGILYTNYPFLYPLHEPAGTDFLRYTPEGARKMLQHAGFEILEEKPIVASNMLVDFYRSEGMKARKDADHTIVGNIIRAKKI